MPQSLQYTIKSSFLAKPKLLVIEADFVTFGTAVLPNGQVQKLVKADIAAVRFGVRGIRGYSFNIGRLYSINIKSKEDDIIKIRFRSFYGVKRQLLDLMYLKIIKALQDNFIHDISCGYIKKFSVKENFTILGITFTQEGLILDKKWALIPWLDVSTKNYSTYYAIYSMTEPDKYKAFKYANDWDTAGKSLLKIDFFCKPLGGDILVANVNQEAKKPATGGIFLKKADSKVRKCRP